MLSQRKLLQLLKSVLLGLAIDDSVFQDRTETSLDYSLVDAVAVAAVLEIPAVSSLVVLKSRVVVAFVEILENGGENFRLFVGKLDAFVGGLEELIAAGRLEEGRVAQDVFVRCEETLLPSNGECDDCTDEYDR